VGKGTLVKALLNAHPDLHLSISATTRQPRPGEAHGQQYYFVDRATFEEMIATDQLLEWAEYAGNLYGTPRGAVEAEIAAGKTVILEIELVGARVIRETFPAAFRVFILPPSLDELERRLRDRGTDADPVIQQRLAHAQTELAASDEFDVQIVNDDFDTALRQIEQAVLDWA
jgi:guanylate kinase